MGGFLLAFAGFNLVLGRFHCVLGTGQGILGAGFGLFRAVQRLLNGGKAIQPQLRDGTAVLRVSQVILCLLIGCLGSAQGIVCLIHGRLVGLAGVGVVGSDGAVYPADGIVLGVGRRVDGIGKGADAGSGIIIRRLDGIVAAAGRIIGALGGIAAALCGFQCILCIGQVLVRIINLGLQVDQVILMLHHCGVIFIHRAVIAGLGLLQGIVVALLCVFDLLFKVGGVQRGDHIAFLHSITHLHIDGGNLVGFGGICHGNAGFIAGFHRAVHGNGVIQAGGFQGRGAHILIVCRSACGRFAFTQLAAHNSGNHRQNDNRHAQLGVAAEPVFAFGCRGRGLRAARIGGGGILHKGGCDLVFFHPGFLPLYFLYKKFLDYGFCCILVYLPNVLKAWKYCEVPRQKAGYCGIWALLYRLPGERAAAPKLAGERPTKAYYPN